MIRTDYQEGNDRVEMIVDVYESIDSVREHIRKDKNAQQPLQHTEEKRRIEIQNLLSSTGSESVKNRSPRSVLVCLVVLYVLLLIAVIVLCVLIYTNTHQFYINNKKITQERDQLLTNNTNLIKQNTKLSQESNRMSKCLKDGWIYYESSMYLFSSERKNWSESRRYCRERRADLTIINNKEEQDFLVRTSHEKLGWIGLSDSDVDDRWKWVDGSTPNISFWGSGEPKSYPGEDCALYNSTGWTTYPCYAKFSCICEKNGLE